MSTLYDKVVYCVDRWESKLSSPEKWLKAMSRDEFLQRISDALDELLTERDRTGDAT